MRARITRAFFSCACANHRTRRIKLERSNERLRESETLREQARRAQEATEQ